MVVKLDLPDGAGLKAGSTPLMYQGLEVGQLSKLNLNADGKVTGEMTVDPSVVSLLREKTLIQMKKPKISLDNPSVSALLTGTTFELVQISQPAISSAMTGSSQNGEMRRLVLILASVGEAGVS